MNIHQMPLAMHASPQVSGGFAKVSNRKLVTACFVDDGE